MGYLDLDYDTYIDDLDFWKGTLNVELPSWAEEISEYGRSVSARDFYTDLFAGNEEFGESDLEEHREKDAYEVGKYAAIALEIYNKKNNDGKMERYGRRTTVTEGCEELFNIIEHSKDFCLIAPISYAGKKRTCENARNMYAMCIEIDGIKNKGAIQELFHVFKRKFRQVPHPTYIVCSGNGLHLYWVFDRPIPLFKNIAMQLQQIRDYMIFQLWDKQITSLWEHIQRESLYQPFRCVGTSGKDKHKIAMAFEVGKRLTIEEFNEPIPDDIKLEVVYKSKLSKAEAKALYPDWYQRRIVEKQDRGHFNRHQGIYYNWIDKIMSSAEVGHRYHCLENLCSLAVQCEIPPEQVYSDCQKVKDKFERLTVKDDNHFTDNDVLCALKTYEYPTEMAYRRKVEYISKKTGIPLIRAKRNGRKMKDHVIVMNKMKEVKRLLGEELNEGRPSAEHIVKRWRELNPEKRKADCIRETGLDKKTVYKWWNTK